MHLSSQPKSIFGHGPSSGAIRTWKYSKESNIMPRKQVLILGLVLHQSNSSHLLLLNDILTPQLHVTKITFQYRSPNL